jgi:chaperonin GroES
MDTFERLRFSRPISVNQGLIESPNLCDRLTPDDLAALGKRVWDGYVKDKGSRSKWERRNEAAMDLAMQVQKAKTFPWPGSSNIVFPLVTIAALQFSARSYANIISGTDIVRYRVAGADPTGALKARAERLGRHMSWQLLEEDECWEEQHDRLLINLGIVGTNFIKSWYDPSRGYVTGQLVTARDLVVNYWARSIDDAPRATQVLSLSQNEIYERIVGNTFSDVRESEWYNTPPQHTQVYDVTQLKEDNRKGQNPPANDEDAPYLFLEQHRYLDLDQDGYAEPYIVTIESSSQSVVRIVARFDSLEQVERVRDDAKAKIRHIKPTQYYTKYGFIPSPDGGLYDLGFGIFLGPINEAVNSIINQMVDHGTLQNSIGGFLGRGFKIRGGVYTMAPWEFKRVDSYGDDIQKNLVLFPERKPSPVMFPLLEMLLNYANRVAGTVDPLVGENPGQNTPASTFQGMQEQGLQIYSMVFKRVWRSMKEEFQQRYELNRIFLRSHQTFGAGGKELVKREDYLGPSDLLAPVADPNMTSTTLRLNQASSILDAATKIPGFDLKEAARDWVKAMRHPEPERIYPGPDKVPPLPNPKVQVEGIKLQGKQLEFKSALAKEMLNLAGQKRLNEAKVMMLTAQAAKLAADAKGAQGAQALEAIEMTLKALNDHNSMINDRIKTLGALSHEGNEGGLGGVDRAPHDAGVPNNAVDVAGGDQGGMGSGGSGGADSERSGALAGETA